MAKELQNTSCAEHTPWTPLPVPPPTDLSLPLRRVDPAGHERIVTSGRMAFHIVGCSGNDPADEVTAIGAAMATQESAFLFHLGDITYDEAREPASQRKLYNRKLLAPFSPYRQPIFAVAGNHDGKTAERRKLSPVDAYLGAFCADPSRWPDPWEHNRVDGRPAMIQPYPFFRLETPLAHVIAVYGNVANAGILDDPAAHPDPATGPQYRWLVEELGRIRELELTSVPRRAVILAVHYPPWSGASNFVVRGDPRIGTSAGREHSRPLGTVLRQAFADGGLVPDLVVSAHAHLYQRLTYRLADGGVMACVVAGSGGHSLENLFERCGLPDAERQEVPFPVVVPDGFAFPDGETAVVEAYEDSRRIALAGSTVKGGSYGFVRIEIENRRLTSTFHRTDGTSGDAFTLDLDARHLTS